MNIPSRIPLSLIMIILDMPDIHIHIQILLQCCSVLYLNNFLWQGVPQFNRMLCGKNHSLCQV